MITKLAFIWTFILAILNVVGVTHIGWGIVLLPSIVAIVWLVIMFALAIVFALVQDSKIKRKLK